MLQNTESAYPNRPITFIVPFGAGGGTDMQARTLEKFASQQLGQPLVVINKPGAAGVIAWNEIVRAKQDGYTLGLSGTEVLLHTLYRPNETLYLVWLDPIAQVMSTPSVLVVNSESPWKNIDEIIAYAKEHPKELKYGHGGIGSVHHIMGAYMAKLTNVELTAVPFQGGGETIAALLGKHIQFAFVNPAVVKEHLRVGTLRAIGITGGKRLTNPALADIPLLRDSGIDIPLTNWVGVVAPKELPPELRKTLEAGFKRAVEDPQFQQYMANLGMEIEYLDHDDSQNKWVKEAHELKKMLEETGIFVEVQAMQQ